MCLSGETMITVLKGMDGEMKCCNRGFIKKNNNKPPGCNNYTELVPCKGSWHNWLA